MCLGRQQGGEAKEGKGESRQWLSHKETVCVLPLPLHGQQGVFNRRKGHFPSRWRIHKENLSGAAQIY
jgi:hypothetical protein